MQWKGSTGCFVAIVVTPVVIRRFTRTVMGVITGRGWLLLGLNVVALLTIYMFLCLGSWRNLLIGTCCVGLVLLRLVYCLGVVILVVYMTALVRRTLLDPKWMLSLHTWLMVVLITIPMLTRLSLLSVRVSDLLSNEGSNCGFVLISATWVRLVTLGHRRITSCRNLVMVFDILILAGLLLMMIMCRSLCGCRFRRILLQASNR